MAKVESLDEMTSLNSMSKTAFLNLLLLKDIIVHIGVALLWAHMWEALETEGRDGDHRWEWSACCSELGP